MRKILVLGSVVFAAVAVACGGSDGSEFGDGSGGNGENGKKVDVVDGEKTIQDPTSLDPSLQACATSVANGQLSPVSLVIMFDKSGSMAFPDNKQDIRDCDTASKPCGNSVECITSGPSTTAGYCADLLPIKWNPAKAALLSFMNDASSSNLKAALNFFPKGSGEASCPTTQYESAGSLVALPSSSFQSVIGGVFPSGETPTLPALTGALKNASEVAKSGEKTVVVLVTDGRPNGCSSTPQNVAEKAKEYSGSISTYVIGVGLNEDDNQNLDLIAQSGGTSKAIRVSTGNTQVELLNALNGIRSQIASCSFGIPSPPAGETIDFKAVNVSIGSSALTYSKDCAAGTGWHYDDPTNPKRIDLCQGSCEASKAAGGKVSLAFGCATKGGVIL